MRTLLPALALLAASASAQDVRVLPSPPEADAPVLLDGHCEAATPMPTPFPDPPDVDPAPMPDLELGGPEPVPMPNLCGGPPALALNVERSRQQTPPTVLAPFMTRPPGAVPFRKPRAVPAPFEFRHPMERSPHLERYFDQLERGTFEFYPPSVPVPPVAPPGDRE